MFDSLRIVRRQLSSRCHYLLNNLYIAFRYEQLIYRQSFRLSITLLKRAEIHEKELRSIPPSPTCLIKHFPYTPAKYKLFKQYMDHETRPAFFYYRPSRFPTASWRNHIGKRRRNDRKDNATQKRSTERFSKRNFPTRRSMRKTRIGSPNYSFVDE